jgi:hypothetical protein
MANKPEPPKTISWNVYKIAKKAIWLGTVEALDKQAAVEKAAQEFKPRCGVCMRWHDDEPSQRRNHPQ